MWEAGAFEGGVADDREIVERRVCLLTDNLLDRDLLQDIGSRFFAFNSSSVRLFRPL